MARSSRLCDYNSRMLISAWGSTEAYSIQAIYISAAIESSPIFLQSLEDRVSHALVHRFGIRIVISKPCHFPVSSHCFTLFEICKRIKGFPGGSQRSSTHEPFGISAMLDMCHNEASRRLDERILSERVLGNSGNGWNDPTVQLSGCGIGFGIISEYCRVLNGWIKFFSPEV